MALRSLGLLIVLCLVSRVGGTQVPADLLGEWQMRQISFVIGRPLPPGMLEQLDDPEIAALNNAMSQHDTELLVSFRADGTYQFGQYEAGQPAWTENGTYRLADGVLRGVAPTAPNGSSFEQHRVVELTRRRLVLEFPFGADSLRIMEQVEYRRRNSGK